ncbi:MAG: sulfotransferase family 2 domain-containing protein [Pseudoruegeria sp.]
MILSRGRKYIFIHIPKTGGTALTSALEARAMKDDILVGDTPKARNRHKRQKDLPSAGRLWKHSTLKDIYGLVDQTEVEHFFVTTIVRNPWDRVVSYYHWLGEQSFDHPAVQLAKSCDFSAFLKHQSTQSALTSSPYRSYVTDRTGVQRCRKFLRLENLQEDLQDFEEHLGFQFGDIPIVNASKRQSQYQNYYSEEDKRIVANCCHVDIEQFGYSFNQN